MLINDLMPSTRNSVAKLRLFFQISSKMLCFFIIFRLIYTYTKARKWANDNLIGKYTAHQIDNEFNYSIEEDAVKKFLSSSSTLNSVNLGTHLAVLRKLPKVIDESVEVEEHPDYKKVNRERKIENGIDNSNLLVHRMYGAVNIDGAFYRVKTTMHETYGKGNVPHDYRVLTKIELLISGSPTSNALSNSITRSNESNIFVSGTNLLKDVDKSYEPGKNCLTKAVKLMKEWILQTRLSKYAILFLLPAVLCPSLWAACA